MSETTNPYRTTQEAEAASQNFIKRLGSHQYRCVCTPALVASTTTGASPSRVNKDVWQLCADALQAACHHYKFEIDGKCTVDAARILRIPTTFNRKHQPPRPCKLDIDVAKGRPSLPTVGP